MTPAEITARFDVLCREAHKEAVAALSLALDRPDVAAAAEHARRAALAADEADVERRCAADSGREYNEEHYLTNAEDAIGRARGLHRDVLLAILAAG